AALALGTLGADARFGTALYATAAPQGGTLSGDLILRGGGDPSLGDASPDWAARFASALSAQGVRRVRGDLIADDSYFSGPSFGDGWEAGDLQTWFGATASALSAQGSVDRSAFRRPAHREPHRCAGRDAHRRRHAGSLPSTGSGNALCQRQPASRREFARLHAVGSRSRGAGRHVAARCAIARGYHARRFRSRAALAATRHGAGAAGDAAHRVHRFAAAVGNGDAHAQAFRQSLRADAVATSRRAAG